MLILSYVYKLNLSQAKHLWLNEYIYEDPSSRSSNIKQQQKEKKITFENRSFHLRYILPHMSAAQI